MFYFLLFIALGIIAVSIEDSEKEHVIKAIRKQ